MHGPRNPRLGTVAIVSDTYTSLLTDNHAGGGLVLYALRRQIAQSSFYSKASVLKVGMIYILGALWLMIEILQSFLYTKTVGTIAVIGSIYSRIVGITGILVYTYIYIFFFFFLGGGSCRMYILSSRGRRLHAQQLSRTAPTGSSLRGRTALSPARPRLGHHTSH